MEVSVALVFTKDIISEGADRFGVTVSGKPLGDFENYIFEAERAGIKYVLRFTHSSHRTEEEVKAEMEFLTHLANGGAHVATPILSRHNQEVETVRANDGSLFYIALFSYAPGSKVDWKNNQVWNDDLFYEWGKTIGQLHRLATNLPKTIARIHGIQEELNRIMLLPEDDPVKAYGLELIEKIKELPVNPESYGLIHSDIHLNNFHYDNGKLTVFDFDDTIYYHYIHDLAIVVYYSTWRSGETVEERSKFARHQLRLLKKGYETEYKLDDKWYEEIPLYLLMRDVSLYAIIYLKFRDQLMPDHIKTVCDAITQRIQKREPLVKLD
ncbi:phosphotransferase enzyme family protein [Brevibacillus daliensis]|uniref:phosphotransferase enzyme family protein n=1 Tax=Brevibacillus daliensis TaxID=2892995 RepID=UPI001E5DA354|nr:phosphotransferase [Brevibacillus daliensis]